LVEKILKNIAITSKIHRVCSVVLEYQIDNGLQTYIGIICCSLQPSALERTSKQLWCAHFKRITTWCFWSTKEPTRIIQLLAMRLSNRYVNHYFSA